jgi:hypothetical protein
VTGRKAPIFGPEPWSEFAGVTWSHWDRWYCIVCVELFAGDWTALSDRLEGRSGSLHVRSDADAKLSHLDDLVLRLDAAGLYPVDLAGAESAIRAQRVDLAAAVFDAANQPGAHRDVLRRRRTELLGTPDGPVLRVIDADG